MRTELPVVSFLCAVLIPVLFIAQRRTLDVAIGSLIIWLCIVNIIQGINALLWADDVSVRAPVWCDLSTRVLYGAIFAFSSISFCILYRLQCTSFSRQQSKPKRTTILTEAFACVILPVMYTASAIIVQDHRFVIVEHFGCQISIFPSVPSIFIDQLPPFLMSFFSLGAAATLLVQSYTGSHAIDRSSVLPKRTMSQATVVRRAVALSLVSLMVLCVVLSTAAATLVDGLHPWTSWSSVHSHLGGIITTTMAELTPSKRVQIEAIWWLVPAVSLVVILALGTGVDAAREYFLFGQALFDRLSPSRRRSIQETEVLPIHLKAHTLVSTHPLAQIHILKSGWDDSLKSTRVPTKATAPPALRLDTSMVRSVTTSVSSEDDSDASFAECTMQYVGSPTGRRALSPEAAGPSPLTTVPTLAPELTVVPPTPSVSSPPALEYVRKESAGAASVISAIDSMLSPGTWPAPPSTIPTSLGAGRAPPAHGAFPATPRDSWDSSASSSFLHMSASSGLAPFATAALSSAGNTARLPIGPTRPAAAAHKKTGSVKRTLRSLGGSREFRAMLAREQGARAVDLDESGIRMTVVKEVV